jgi:hypothetical protein
VSSRIVGSETRHVKRGRKTLETVAEKRKAAAGERVTRAGSLGERAVAMREVRNDTKIKKENKKREKGDRQKREREVERSRKVKQKGKR